MVNGINANVYHYKIYSIDKDNNISNEQFFLSAKEISNLYNITTRTIYNLIKNPKIKSRKLGNIIIERIHIPKRIVIDNPLAIKKNLI